jgi:hypothetical protein
VSTHWRTGTWGISPSASRAAKSHILRPMQLGQNPLRSHEKATARPHPQSRHFTKTRPCARIPYLRNASISETTNAGSAAGSEGDSMSARKVFQWTCRTL